MYAAQSNKLSAAVVVAAFHRPNSTTHYIGLYVKAYLSGNVVFVVHSNPSTTCMCRRVNIRLSACLTRLSANTL